MKKSNLINFLKEEKQEEKFLKCTIAILIYLLVFQIYTNIKSINILNDEINDTKAVIKSTIVQESKNKKSTLIKDTNKIYDLLGFSNVERLSIENNKVNIEGKCKKLDILEEIRSMENINNFSIKSVENKNNKFYFYVVYEIGGLE